MPERRVSDVVGKRSCFAKLWVSTDSKSYALGNLSHFERVRESCSEEVALPNPKHLSLPSKSPERRTVQYPIAIDLKLTSLVSPRGVGLALTMSVICYVACRDGWPRSES